MIQARSPTLVTRCRVSLSIRKVFRKRSTKVEQPLRDGAGRCKVLRHDRVTSRRRDPARDEGLYACSGRARIAERPGLCRAIDAYLLLTSGSLPCPHSARAMLFGVPDRPPDRVAARGPDPGCGLSNGRAGLMVHSMTVSSSAMSTTGGPPLEIFRACARASWPLPAAHCCSASIDGKWISAMR